MRSSLLLRDSARTALVVGAVALTAALWMLVACGRADENKGSQASRSGHGRVVVCFRCDDIRAVQGESDKHVLATYRSILAEFSKAKCPLTLGVIPDSDGTHRLTSANPTSQLLLQYKDSPCFEVALHGIKHPESRPGTEFCGVPYQKQCAMIKEGLDILLDSLGTRQVRTFVPPWDSYDLNTLKAARKQGFRCLSGDAGLIRKSSLGPWTHEETTYEGMVVIPATCSMRELLRAIEFAKADAENSIVVVVFHPYDFKEYHGHSPQAGNRLTITDLSAIVARVTKDETIECLTIGELPCALLPSERYTACCRYVVATRSLASACPRRLLTLSGIVDERVGCRLPKGRYLGSGTYRALERTCLTWTLAVMSLAGMTCGCLVGSIVRHSRRRRVVFIAYWLIALLVVFGLHYRYEFATAPAFRHVFLAACAAIALTFAGLVLGAISFRKRRRTASAQAEDAAFPASDPSRQLQLRDSLPTG